MNEVLMSWHWTGLELSLWYSGLVLGVQLHKRAEKSSWKDQKLLQEQREMKILSGFC